MNDRSGKPEEQPTEPLGGGVDPVPGEPLPGIDPMPAVPPGVEPVSASGTGDIGGFGAPGPSPARGVAGGPVGTTGGSAVGHPGYDAYGRPVPRPPRTSEQIRADIEEQRQQLGSSVEQLRDRVHEVTDWRGHLRRHRREIAIGAAAVGFAVGASIMLGRRNRR